MAIRGETHTKTCIGYRDENGKSNCGVELLVGYNWEISRAVRKEYHCHSCHKKQAAFGMRTLNARRRGEPKPKFRDFFKPDPMLLAVRDRNRAALQFVENMHTGIVEGFVYVITNPAWPGWVKIGSAVDPESRNRSYQTGSPYRDYVLEGYGYSPDRKRTEHAVHIFLGRESGEWFHMPVVEAVKLVKKFCSMTSTNGKDAHANERETLRDSEGVRTPEADAETLSDLIDNACDRGWNDTQL